MKKKVFQIITVCMLVLSMPLMAFAHGGRTDGSGGHKDNKNKSGLGGYHYHCGGYPAHLHTNGVCPYRGGGSSSSSTTSSTPKTVYASRINAVAIPATINAGESTQLKGAVYPSNAVDDEITWSSENPDIASVSSSGNLVANGVGTATIIAKTEKGTTSKFTITVKEVFATAIEIENKSESIKIDEEIELSVLFTPENTTNKDIEWSSSDESIATVSSDGTLVGVNLGTATITAVHKEFQDSFEIEVKPVEADSIEIVLPDDAEIPEETDTTIACKLKKDGSLQLSAEITPENTTDKSVKWSVNDEEIATIDENGLLTAIGTGTVIVTAESSNGITTEIEIELYSDAGNIATGIIGLAAIGGGGYAIYHRKKKKKEAEVE